MQLTSLSVFHLNKGPKHALIPPELRFMESAGPEKVFRFETCQRWIWISTVEILPLFSARGTDVQVYSGEMAYRFLLRVATGLESEIIGETDVFGQLKEAWRQLDRSDCLGHSDHCGNHPSLVSELSSWMQRLFEDTKEIRNHYLQNLGGASYGTLTRKWLKQVCPGSKANESVLLVGCGQIAQSIAPFLLDHELWLTNRTESNLSFFYDDLMSRNPHGKFTKLTSEENAWREADQIIVCIPFHSEKDRQRIEWFQQGKNTRRILHLGGTNEQAGEWSKIPQFYCLSDLFQLQSDFGNIRSTQVMRAERACADRAQLRGLGTSLSISHGWEDLMCFA